MSTVNASSSNNNTIELKERDDMRFVMLGSGGVGKSAISIQYIKASYTDRYDPTIEDAYTKATQVDGKPVQVNLLDTAGQEEFTGMYFHVEWFYNIFVIIKFHMNSHERSIHA